MRSGLDLVRYADTDGGSWGRPRSMWPYRDWVIRALNQDMFFTRFTIDQIADDLLPGATASQVVAAGMRANTTVNQEDGVDLEEVRWERLIDQVGTTVGATDDLGYGIFEDPVHVHDLHATVLELMGLDLTKLTYRHQGRVFRLTDTSGKVVRKLQA